MRNLIIILTVFTLTSCLTERRFNKMMTKGIEKGWVDTSTKMGNYVYITKIDTLWVQGKTDSLVDTIFNDETIYRDTCFNKKGKVIGRITDTSKLKYRLKKSVTNDLVLPEIVHCLKAPLFYDKDGIIVEVSQDSLGYFNIKVKQKNIFVSRPNDRAWYNKYFLDVWYLYFIIMVLTLIIIIKR